MTSMRDCMIHSPDEHGPKEFSFRGLKGKAHSAGYIQVFLMKNQVLQHFLETLLPKFPSEHFKELVKRHLTTHAEFRKMCGSSVQAVDLSWLGGLSDSERQAVSYLKARPKSRWQCTCKWVEPLNTCSTRVK